MPTTIHLWTPGLFDFKGGIQTYSSFLLEGLQAVLPGATLRVFTLHDAPATLPTVSPASVSYHTTGHVPARLRTAAFAAQTSRAALSDRPDLIITTHVNLTPVAHALKRWANLPYWGVAHGFEAWEVAKPQVRRGMAGADKILSVSGFTCDRIRQSQALQNLGILPNTFDSHRFQVAPKPLHLLKRYGLRPEQPVILTVNRLAAGEPFHSYDQILAALPTIQTALPQVHYLIVGKGDDRPRLERLIADRHLQDCVTLAGFVADEELPDHYALCDVFAMPSQLEGFGIVYLEAMACGRPVLAGLDGGQDALKQGELGALVDPEDVAAIADHLVQILTGTYSNPLMYQPQALRQRAIEAFGQQAFQRCLAAHLSEQIVPGMARQNQADQLRPA
ncbi:glycosyltransferase [Leptolyngbya sp. CCNP1308]|uniref:glycosyltransferase n=1 Tax=Leptolyngbya sp. CCNP1308 TaxID=3110255 RepID=UPI002B1F876D|nr:glycosyltransferase [Leptolyngbya sp. CCNP1308]MEA5452440.1 glycosyltransferase [Leptolyngbya sp. CCNP1308]